MEAKYPWEGDTGTRVPVSGRLSWFLAKTKIMLLETTDVDLRGSQLDIMVKRLAFLDLRLEGKEGEPLLMVNAWDYQDVTMLYRGTIGEPAEISFPHDERHFVLPVSKGVVCITKKGGAGRAPPWNQYKILPEWFIAHPRRLNHHLPVCAICVGEEEIEKYLALAGSHERASYEELVLESRISVTA